MKFLYHGLLQFGTAEYSFKYVKNGELTLEFGAWHVNKWILERNYLFSNILGRDVPSLITNLPSPKTFHSMPFDSLNHLIQQKFSSINSEAARRAKFHFLTRRFTQSIRQFISESETLASKNNFGDQLESALQDLLTFGISSSDLDEPILLPQECTFQSSKLICEQRQEARTPVNSGPRVALNVGNSHSIST